MIPCGATLRLGLVGISFAVGQAAAAHEGMPSPLKQADAFWQSDFDLATDTAPVPVDADFTADAFDIVQNAEQAEKVFPVSKPLVKTLRPYWKYKPRDEGPSIEFGSLGAGMKKAPGLAHLGVDWNF